MRTLPWLLLLTSLPALGQEQMTWDEPIVCVQNPEGETLRAQCRTATKVCLFSGVCLKGTRGEHCRTLERTASCSVPPDGMRPAYDALIADKYTFREAIAEAPAGWQRDAIGRVFQVNFDLNRRVWLGSRYAPSFGPGTANEVGRVGLEFGIHAENLDGDLRGRYRLTALTGEVLLNPLSIDAVVLQADTSRDNDEPFLRFTTFWGGAARHDAYADVGWWAELMAVQMRPRGSLDETEMRLAALALTLDLWHSADLSSYVRIRGGAAFDDLYLSRKGVKSRLAATPLGYVESDVTFDRDGFHHLHLSSGFEAPFVWLDDDKGMATMRKRFVNELAYEVILLAINDQPLTFRTSITGGYRDDLEGAASGWEVTAGAGLRLSLWAPPRDLDELSRAEKQKAGR